MRLFNEYCRDRSSGVWVVRLTHEELKQVQSDGFSVRSNLAVYWPPKADQKPQLLILKQRWEDYSHLL